MKRCAWCFGVLLLVLLSGCNRAAILQMIAPKEDEAVAQYYIGLLFAGDFGPIERDIDPTLQGSGMHGALLQAAHLLPGGEPESVKLVGFKTFRGNDLYQTDLTYEYQFSEKWLLINLATQKKGNVFTIIGLRVTPIPDSLERLNRFTLYGKRPLQYLFLVWAAATPLFIFYCLILFIRDNVRDNPLKRRWLWILFILFGCCELSLNWTTGQFAFTPTAVQLFGLSGFAAPYGPWIFKMGFPLGALIYLLRRRRMESSPLPAEDGANSQPPEF